MMINLTKKILCEMKKQSDNVFSSPKCVLTEKLWQKQKTLSHIYLSKTNFSFQTKLKYGNKNHYC